MPRRKKTRSEKKRADERKVELFQQQSQQTVFAPTYTFSSTHSPAQHTKETAGVSYLSLIRKDLLKTAFVSVFILAIQIILFSLLKYHVLAFSLVRY